MPRHREAVASLDELLELPLDAVAIATPVSTHFPLARRAWRPGCTCSSRSRWRPASARRRT